MDMCPKKIAQDENIGLRPGGTIGFPCGKDGIQNLIIEITIIF